MVEEDIEFTTFDGDTITKSDYREEIIDAYTGASYDGLTQVTDFTVGSEAYHLADVLATFLLEQRELIDSNYRMAMINTAEGEFLDNYGDMVGVHRIGSSPSVGQVTFTRLTEDTTRPIDIADGTQVLTEDAISFIVDSGRYDEEGNPLPVILETGQTSVNANVICEYDGAYTNIDPHTIKIINGTVAALCSVDNNNKFTEGADIESDDEYRNRITEAPSYVPTGTLAWYKNVAEEVTYTIEDPEDESELITRVACHDVTVNKGTGGASDVVIYFNPMYPSDIDADTGDTMAEKSLNETFNMPEYDVAGVTVDLTEAEATNILVSVSSVKEYLFAVLVETGYELTDLKDAIADKIVAFSNDSSIHEEFNPGNLCISIEEVTGVSSARVIEHDLVGDSYKEIVEPISVEDGHVYRIKYDSLTELKSRIQKLVFSIDLELEEG